MDYTHASFKNWWRLKKEHYRSRWKKFFWASTKIIDKIKDSLIAKLLEMGAGMKLESHSLK